MRLLLRKMLDMTRVFTVVLPNVETLGTPSFGFLHGSICRRACLYGREKLIIITVLAVVCHVERTKVLSDSTKSTRYAGTYDDATRNDLLCAYGCCTSAETPKAKYGRTMMDDGSKN